ncbi:MAG TPA: DUF87 domain-containing protein [Verrucomicrobiales bacterium]|nr:DUF87 domain-containing protein [Verrucomicrobiales bacterium]
MDAGASGNTPGKTMEIDSDIYEKLGVFYLGREYDMGAGKATDSLLLYESKDLVTHGVVLGMTGSGKTGLCIAILEEAAMDGIPAVIVDPKGDIANLLLTFPGLNPSDFLPWINEDDARRKGQSPEDFAAAQAELWRKGLEEWGQSGDRIRRLREHCAMRIYTPGSTAGIPVSILSSLTAPPPQLCEDAELLGDRVESTATSLLSLLGIDADPIQSREHILLSRILHDRWEAGEDLTLARLIGLIQSPGFDAVGVLPLEEFYPEDKRSGLAMQMNHLLASPGFRSWMEGVPLDLGRMMQTPEGKACVSVFSIAHLEDSQRMFFVSLLLNELVGWMRAQSGTTSLRALFYMDEIFGYLPPVANPPAKKPLMTILKQGRAFGLGALLATQNPVDLDYKALSNAGTWFLGRLQTQRDKDRVLAGLEGAAVVQGGSFDRGELEAMLSALGNRVFLMNNVHEDGPVTFQVRWVMSYLRGPLSRDQTRRLAGPQREMVSTGAAEAVRASPLPAATGAGAGRSAVPVELAGLKQAHFPLATPASGPVVYEPAVLTSARVEFAKAKFGLHGAVELHEVLPLDVERGGVDFSRAVRLDRAPPNEGMPGEPEASYEAVPAAARQQRFYRDLEKSVRDWLYQHYRLTVFQAKELKAWSRLGETEGEFRARLRLTAREERDLRVEALRRKFQAAAGSKLKQREAAARAVEREREQAGQAKIGTAISVGSAILGALLGRKRMGVGTMTRGATAARSVSRSWKESQDVGRAEERLQGLNEEIAGLEEELQRAIDAAGSVLDPVALVLAEVKVAPLKKDIFVRCCSLAWLPCGEDGVGLRKPLWKSPV